MMHSTRALGAAMTPILLLFLLSFFSSASAFLPATPLPRAVRTHSAGVTSFHAPVRRQSALSMEIDWDYVYGGGAALAGTAVGWGMAAFVDYAAERSEARGAMSEETKMRMSAKLMDEDIVAPTDDDMLTNLRRAVRSNMSEEERAAMDEKNRKEAADEDDEDDGW